MHRTEFVTYHPQYLDEIVAFWNAEFAERRNFFALTAADFEARVALGGAESQPFAPEHLLLAREDGRIVGLIHVLKRDRDTCRQLFPDREPISQGAIAFFAVARDRRGHGIGAEMFRRAEAMLEDCDEIAIDGQCLAPFYGNARGPYAPVWGTTEGPSVSEDDIVTVEFLEKRNYNPRWRGVSLAVRLDLLDAATLAQGQVPEDCMLQTFSSNIEVPAANRASFFETSFITGGEALGSLVFYEMREVAQGAGAIYHFEVDEKFRGRGIGREVLRAALRFMRQRNWRTCEVLTVPDLSPEAVDLYARHGFESDALWLIY